MKTLAAAPTRAQRRAEQHRQAGLAAIRGKLWAQASREFEQATALTPRDSLMWLNLARSRMHQHDLEGAAEAADRALRLDPGSPVAARAAAEIRQQMNDPAAAVLAFETLPADAPRDFDFHNAYGNALFMARRPREAVDAFFKALALKVDAAIVHYRLGLCFMDLAMTREAAECFRTAVSLDNGAVRALALSLLVHESGQACDWSHIEEDTRALLDAIDAPDDDTGRLLSPFALLAINASPAQQRRMGALRLKGLIRQVTPFAPPGPRRPGPIRVGYLSAD